jgi:(R,R)-butanediol dehydrogenase / meso-butanediol dehydrogenase / diacetyl reductase
LRVKAVVCAPDAPCGSEVVTVDDPRPGPGEVVVDVEACGLCGSDVHTVERGRGRPGQILGHEFGGRIAELGPGVAGWRVGQPVAVNPVGSCRACRACERGIPWQCEATVNLGVTAPGAYAEYAAAPASYLVPLPDGVPVEMGAHAEPLAVALRAVSIAGVGPGDAALVHGVGPIGLNVIMCLRLAGAELIVGAGRSPGRRAAAAKAGAGEVIDTSQISVGEFARQAGRRFAAVLECSAAPGAITEALSVLEPGGICVEVALTPETPPVSLMGMVSSGLRLAGSCSYSPAEYEAAVDHIASGRVPAADLISERVSLDALPSALARLRHPGSLVRLLARP